MKKIILFVALTLITAFSFVPGLVQAEDVAGKNEKIIEYNLFHLETCPHCKDEIKFVNEKILPKYGEFIHFQLYDMVEAKSQELYEQFGYFYDVKLSGGVPVAFIDDEVVQGYGADNTTGKQIMDIVERKLQDKGLIESVGDDNEVCEDGKECISVSVLGRIDAKTFSLPILTVVIGLLDGFNPCAMWVLIFLITLLLGMKNKKRMWLLGSIFIAASGIVYFIFMAAWLQFLMFIGMIIIIRVIIGLVAIGAGSINLRDYWKNRKSDGVVCKVSGKEGTKTKFEKIKDIVYRKSLWWSIIGIIILGFSVNLVELACSAGFPAIFTQVLALNDLPMWQKYLYMFGYIVFYMLDDMVVFILAMITLQSKTVGGKYAKYANLVGGALIFILGVLLIFRPEWLMFG